MGWIRGEIYLIETHSKDALGSFQSTLDSLKVIEQRIADAVDKKQAKVDKLASQVSSLVATKEKNSRVANKINEFLNGD